MAKTFHLKHKNWERLLSEANSWVLPPELFWFINPNWAGGTFNIPLSLCLQVSCLRAWGHHSARGVIPRPAGSALSLGFRREKPIRPLNRNNDPPLNTPREECDEEFVQGKSRSSCWQCLQRPDHGELCPLNCSKKPPLPRDSWMWETTVLRSERIWTVGVRQSWVWIVTLPFLFSMLWQHLETSAPLFSYLQNGAKTYTEAFKRMKYNSVGEAQAGYFLLWKKSKMCSQKREPTQQKLFSNS